MSSSAFSKLEGGAADRAEALLRAAQYREAVAAATGALRRRPKAPEEARLRLVRGRALWHLGSVLAGRAEVRKAAGRAEDALTCARAEEAMALMAWRAQELDAARAHLERARGLHAQGGSVEGEGRVLELEAGILRDLGCLEQALSVLDRRVELARGRSVEETALAQADRGALLTSLARWDEARQALSDSASAFRSLGDLREFTVTSVARAVLDLATGELAEARIALERACALQSSEGGDPRALAEILMLLSDLHLAAGDPGAAERVAAEALGFLGLAQDRRSEAWCRIRRSHALLALGRAEEALREARRASRLAAPMRLLVTAWANLALGRCLLRVDLAEAARAFERVLEMPSERRDLEQAARLGVALARGEALEHELRAGLEALAVWGDRRMLAYAVSDARELRVRGPQPAPALSPPAPTLAACSSGERTLVDVALALAGPGPWPERWGAAMRALGRAVPWWRAVLVCGEGLELRRDLGHPVALAAEDFARQLAASSPEPAVLDLGRHPAAKDSPARLLHRLATGLVAPVCPGAWLWLDGREDARFGEHALGLLAQAARLVGAHWEASGGSPPSASAEVAFPEVVGRSPVMQALFRSMARVGPSEVSVHIFGETGTGKGRVAEALHRSSRRQGGPFVAINASSLSDELFETEMFGHVRGSFTGAVGSREGHVAAAEGGTLFIDEVADLTPRAQAKLLRVLQDREYRRVGESGLRRANVRILTAANVELEKRVAAGLFREDLLYRLTVITLRLPPLRERGEDVLLLARHFLREAAQRDGGPPRPLPPEVSRALLGYAWPGNVRELENELSSLLVLAGPGPLRPEQLSSRVRGERAASPRHSLREARLAFEREFIARALGDNGGNRARTAVVLGLTRQALLCKLQRLGLS